jgi:hypothetical protein
MVEGNDLVEPGSEQIGLSLFDRFSQPHQSLPIASYPTMETRRRAERKSHQENRRLKG